MVETVPTGDATGIVDRPLPAWLKPPHDRTRPVLRLGGRALITRRTRYGLKGYRTYHASRLRASYFEIEMDLQSVYEHFGGEDWFDHHSARQVVSILDSVLPELELAQPNLDVVDDSLGLARRLMVWVTPPAWIGLLAEKVEGRLRESTSPEARRFSLDGGSLVARRYRLAEAIGILDGIATSQAVDKALQVRRLELIRNTGIVAAGLLIGFAPILVARQALPSWNLGQGGLAWPVDAWLTTVGIGLLGAIGALLSGLLQARRSPVTYADYEVRGIEIALRILVGSAVAVTAYYLLSWGVVPAVNVTSAGTFLLVAFAAGFSERYFLKLLGLDAEAEAEDHAGAGEPEPAEHRPPASAHTSGEGNPAEQDAGEPAASTPSPADQPAT